MLRRILVELFGTFCLVFAGTGAIVINDVSGGAVTHVGIAISFGLVVYVMIESVGAQMNPAVTLGLWVARSVPWTVVVPKIMSQAAGALLASLALSALFPVHDSLGATRPSGSVIQTFALETGLTLVLMVTILSFVNGSTDKQARAGLTIGALIGLEALFAGQIGGASMNPARSLGPAIVSGRLDSLWIYLTAPVLGAVLGVGLHRLLQPPTQTESET